MEPFAHVPKLLIALPVGLLVLDGIYKWWIFDHAPYDAAADASLAALTFSAVHLITKLLQPEHAVAVHPGVIPIVIGQFAAWPLALKWGQELKKAESRFILALSYAVGGWWFAYSVGWLLVLVPA